MNSIVKRCGNQRLYLELFDNFIYVHFVFSSVEYSVFLQPHHLEEIKKLDSIDSINPIKSIYDYAKKNKDDSFTKSDYIDALFDKNRI